MKLKKKNRFLICTSKYVYGEMMMKWKETRSQNFSSYEFTDVPLAAVDAPPQPQVDGTAPTFSKKPTIIQVTTRLK